MSGKRKLVFWSGSDPLPEEQAPWWLAYLRILKELGWQTERGSKERDDIDERMGRARERWLRGDDVE
jgi:hypothetical protein